MRGTFAIKLSGKPQLIAVAFQSPLTLLFLIIVSINPAGAEPNQLGQTGLINMPDARIEKEGTLRLGLSHMKPYTALWSSVSAFSWLELSARYTEINNVDGFTNRPDDNFGDYKDKAFDTKIRILKETRWFPQVTVGLQDYLGNKVFEGSFLTLSKKLGEFDFTLGAGKDRLDGIFGGLRYNPGYLKNWSFVAEYDAIDYDNEFRADVSRANKRKGGPSFGVNYHWGWLGAQLSYQQENTWGLYGYVSIPLQQDQFIPKLHEPAPFTNKSLPVGFSRPTIAQWENNVKYTLALINALETQDYDNVRVTLKGSTLEIGVATPRISLMGRAVGRATRTALLMSPIGVDSIRVSYFTLKDLPVLTYQFNDLNALNQFFSGQLTYGDLIKEMKVEYSDPNTLEPFVDESITSLAGTSSLTESVRKNEIKIEKNVDGHYLRLSKADNHLSGYQIIPVNLGIFFNDPSGAFKYDWFMTANYQRYLGNAWFVNAGARMTVLENVSDVTQLSNSLLPHVRTDVASYKEERGLKVDNLLLNKYFHLQPRFYARWSAGIYEEMFGGTGGQILYLPKDQNWAVDLSVDWLKQRDYGGDFEFLDYETTTSILSLHYRIKSQGLRFTLRGGRFLAKDEGTRMEISRRFRSGIKIGAWYTYTNGDDTTGPGTEDDPYQDKGIFMQIPLGSMLTKDTRAKVDMSIRPWTRDGGQMVKTPGDLYELFDSPLMLDRPEYHLLGGFHE